MFKEEGGTKAFGWFPWDFVGCMKRLDRSDVGIHPIRMQKYTPPLTGQILLKTIYASIFYKLFMIPDKHILEYFFFHIFVYEKKTNRNICFFFNFLNAIFHKLIRKVVFLTIKTLFFLFVVYLVEGNVVGYVVRFGRMLKASRLILVIKRQSDLSA